MKETTATAKKAPKKRKERDLGTPTVIVRYLDAEPQMRGSGAGYDVA